MAFFSFKTYLYRIFWLEFEISASELTPVPNFSSIGQKIRELEFWPGTIPKTAWWRHTCLLVMTSAKFWWFLRDFVPEYHHAKFDCNWTTNKGETEGGTMCLPPAYMVPKDPSLNRVKYNFMLPCHFWFHVYSWPTLTSEMYNDSLGVRNCGKLSPKFLVGTSTVIEKVAPMSYFLFLARTIVRICLKVWTRVWHKISNFAWF